MNSPEEDRMSAEEWFKKGVAFSELTVGQVSITLLCNNRQSEDGCDRVALSRWGE